MRKATGMVKLIAGATVGAGLAYAFDPDRGKARRARLKTRTRAQLRRTSRALERRAHYEGQKVAGLRHKMMAGGGHDAPSDHVVADRVRSKVFGHMPGIAHHVNLDVIDAAATLRGERDHPAELRT